MSDIADAPTRTPREELAERLRAAYFRPPQDCSIAWLAVADEALKSTSSAFGHYTIGEAERDVTLEVVKQLLVVQFKLPHAEARIITEAYTRNIAVRIHEFHAAVNRELNIRARE